MAYLFAYGTLQDSEIQRLLFQRSLTGYAETLQGFQLSENKVYGRYPAISPTDNPLDTVKGMVYEVASLELKKVDAYEGEGYERCRIDLASGKTAWAYIARQS